MGKALILETTFLVDLERELNRGDEGAAHQFLEACGEHRLYITDHRGRASRRHLSREPRRVGGFRAPFRILATNEDVVWEYG